MWKEFKEFAIKGNAVELAVGVVIGAAFSQVVNSIVNDVLNPILSLVTGRVDFSHLRFGILGHQVMYGSFLNAVLNFLLVSFAVFLVIKQFNRFRRQPQAAPSEKLCPFCQISIPIAASRCPHCTSQLP